MVCLNNGILVCKFRLKGACGSVSKSEACKIKCFEFFLSIWKFHTHFNSVNLILKNIAMGRTVETNSKRFEFIIFAWMYPIFDIAYRFNAFTESFYFNRYPYRTKNKTVYRFMVIKTWTAPDGTFSPLFTCKKGKFYVFWYGKVRFGKNPRFSNDNNNNSISLGSYQTEW